MTPQPPGSTVRLADYDNSWYQPGRSRLWQAAWFLLGLPVLRSALVPSSALRVKLLRLFGAHIGDGVVIKPGVQVKYPWHLHVGDHCWLGEACWIDNLTTVRIGSNVCISQGAYLCTGNHDWADPTFGLMVAPITLGDGAWAGARSVLMPGVELGAGAIAGAGSVVSKNIPAFEIHAGNPAQFARHRRLRAADAPREGSAEAPPTVETVTMLSTALSPEITAAQAGASETQPRPAPANNTSHVGSGTAENFPEPAMPGQTAGKAAVTPAHETAVLEAAR